MATVKYIAKQSQKQDNGVIIADVWLKNSGSGAYVGNIVFRNGWDKDLKKPVDITHEIPGGASAAIVRRQSPKLNKAGQPIEGAPNAFLILNASEQA